MPYFLLKQNFDFSAKGLSLWYAEIPPVEVISSEAGDRVWEKLATENFIKIKQDVTRHRYI
jgi:hypothetical protein